MKRLLALPVILFLGLVSVLVWFYINVQPVASTSSYQNFLIEKGSSAGTIGTNLEKAGLIKSALVFRIYTHLVGISGSIGTGEFRLSSSYNLFQIIDTLTSGPIEIWVTVPEGLRREEIAAKFAKSLEKDTSFVSEFLDASSGKEGMLFPDTYLFPKEASASAVVAKMTSTFSAKTSSLTASSGLTFGERLILASILERETKTDAERPVVAGILINRLNLGMPLQVDATVQYALANTKCQTLNAILNCNWWPTVYQGDLSINSPYNTYKFAGLPPGPISNPGLSSLKAAFNPTQSDYLYYIHDPSGQIHYAKTLEEQNANVQKYLR